MDLGLVEVKKKPQWKIKQEQLKEFDFIISNYKYVLVDTCALISPFYSLPRNTLEEKTIYANMKYNCTVFFEKHFPTEKLYVTQFVFDEFSESGIYPAKKNIKRSPSKRDLLDLRRSMNRSSKACRCLLRIIEEYEKIIGLNENEGFLHREFTEKYFPSIEEFEVSEADFDLLIHGAVLARKRGNCALISNDSPLFFFWRDFSRKEKFDYRQLGFFTRQGVFVFEQKTNDFDF